MYSLQILPDTRDPRKKYNLLQPTIACDDYENMELFGVSCLYMEGKIC